MQNKKAFTLVELVVGITISMIIMVSVGLFVSSGIKTTLKQESDLKGYSDFNTFFKKANEIFDSVDKSFTGQISSTGLLLKIGKDYDSGGFTFIGTKQLDKVFCPTGSEDTKTDHLYIKTFIPFEESGEDIFTNFNDILTGSIVSGPNTFISDQKNHVVTDGTNVIIGKGVFGGDQSYTGGLVGTGIYLNSPTGLAYDTSNNILYISDTLNDRILYYNTTDSKIYKLLGREDGISQPTGLLFDNNILYISNSGKGEILKYSSESITNPDLEISIITEIDIAGIDRFSIEFFDKDSNPINITSSIGTSDFTFTPNINTYQDYFDQPITSDELVYYFTNYTNSSGPTSVFCTGNSTTYSLNGSGNPIKEVISSCDLILNSGDLTTYIGNESNSFNQGSIYGIDVGNIAGSFGGVGVYYTNLKLMKSDGSVEYEEYFPYFVNGDDDILTKGDNTLEILTGGLDYPTRITLNGANLDVVDFVNRTTTTISKTGAYISAGSNLLGIDLNKFDYNKDTDYLLKKPINSIDLDFDSVTDRLLTFILKYYKSYNCYNLDDKLERSFILKKNFKVFP